ncbi:MAG TPA: aldo/keto reductase [Chromatiaceae bacterium]|nr:aldo/keto reductase [Chromatiaceae bacterium]
MVLRPLGDTGIEVSPLGLGTVKLGRDRQVKYPRGFRIPDDAEARELLSLAADLGINLLDTAPAYGVAEERLGRLLPGPRSRWVIVSKAGEQFRDGRSFFDFSFDGIVHSVERSLRDLRSDYLDAVLIHSNGDDLAILDDSGAVDALESLKQRGLIRAHGMSSKTVAGGLAVVERLDIVMATCNTAHTEEIPVLLEARRRRKGVLVKKALQSGHDNDVASAMRFIFSQPGVGAIIIGTINPAHLRDNARIVAELLDA